MAREMAVTNPESITPSLRPPSTTSFICAPRRFRSIGVDSMISGSSASRWLPSGLLSTRTCATCLQAKRRSVRPAQSRARRPA